MRRFASHTEVSVDGPISTLMNPSAMTDLSKSQVSGTLISSVSETDRIPQHDKPMAAGDRAHSPA
ncbi:MAG: hypothetical protein EBW06_11300 [Gammaproteobacteria bacterium]|nr:hypothetical protein [Gammaproteobacteria bacterium]